MAAKFTVLPKAPSLRELAHEVRLKEYFSYGLLPSSPDGLATSLMEGGFWQCGRLSGFAKATERASQLKEIMKASVITLSCRRCTPSRASP